MLTGRIDCGRNRRPEGLNVRNQMIRRHYHLHSIGIPITDSGGCPSNARRGVSCLRLQQKVFLEEIRYLADGHAFIIIGGDNDHVFRPGDNFQCTIPGRLQK